ncbi:MAG: transposase, partial [Pyrinomonadaceae bacterium]
MTDLVDDYGFEVFEENQFPLAYLLTFRTFGSWLHGDKRGAVGRDGRNRYGGPRMKPNTALESALKIEARQPQLILSKPMRRCVETSIAELCQRRGYLLQAVNARSNHVHAVVSAEMKPERLADALKANATKHLREQGLIPASAIPWSRGRAG